MSIEVRHPEPHNVAAMKRIWEYSFGDTKEYIDFFFDNCFVPERALVAYYDLKPAGMLFLLPAKLCIENKEYQGQYIYAVATKPDYRNMGIMRQLEEMAVVKAKESNLDFLCLVPQTPSLFKMYEKIGYHTVFYITEKTYMPLFGVDKEVKIQDCSLDDYLHLRQFFLSKMPTTLDFIAPLNEYRYLEFKKAGGDIMQVNAGDKQGFYAGYIADKTYIIRETSLDEKTLKKVMSWITQQYEVDDVKVFGLKGRVNEIQPFGMFKSWSHELDARNIKSLHPYMNMMLN